MQIPLLFSSYNYVRIPENNDWVVLCILGGILAFVFMLHSLNREVTLKDFIMQPMTESSNGPLNWFVISAVYSVLLSVFISQYVPIVPKIITDFHPLGLELNKFGYTFLCVCGFYILKLIFSYIFFISSGSRRRWFPFYFVASRYYIIYAIVLMILCIAHYYLPIDKRAASQYYTMFFALAFLFKIAFYWMNKNHILPLQWYHKLLYICTLQFAPLLVLWKLLFL